MTALAMHCWDGECVVYHPASGNVHRLTEGQARVLHSLEAGTQDTLSIDMLIEWGVISASADTLEGVDIGDFLSEIEREFTRVGLIDPP